MTRRHLPRYSPTRSDPVEAKMKQFAPQIPVELPRSAQKFGGYNDEELMRNAKQCKTAINH